MDAVTGRVIAHSEAGQPWYPASITKLMTAFVAFRAMREGRVTPDTLLTVSANAVAQAPTKMGFGVGTQVTVDNALKMLMVKSANDMAVAIAEGIGGSYDKFISEMNITAQELGMTATHYANPNGLPDEGQVTSARDMAILARAIIREFPEHEMMFRIPAIQLGKQIIRNHNKLIDHYPGADGMKTGFICASGFNIVATAKRGSKRLIVVVLGGRSGATRNEDAAKLFQKGFSPLAPIAAVFRNEPRTIESIPNLNVAPVDLHDQICGSGRKKMPAESDIDDEPQEADSLDGDRNDSVRKDPKTKQSLLVDLPPSMQPIRVFVGSASQTEAQKIASGGDDKAVKGKRAKKGKGKDKQSEITTAHVASPQGGPLVPAATQSVPPQSVATQTPEEGVKFSKPANMISFTPPAPLPLDKANMTEGLPLDQPNQPTVTAAPAPAPSPSVNAAAERKPAVQSAQRVSGNLPSSAQAFAAQNSNPFGPAIGSFTPTVVPEPPLELPSSVPMPRSRPKDR
jgi:D-alanyl-D-alanine carboxypeptidase